MSGAWPYHLAPDEYGSLQFADYPCANVRQVAADLYRSEPRFMQALEADIRARGVLEAVELGAGDAIKDGHHRVAAAYAAGQAVPVALYGEDYPRDRAEQARWAEIRQRHPGEHEARMAHDPRRWADRDLEAGQ